MINTVVPLHMVQDPREDDEVEEDDEFRCPICGETFESQQELEDHGETHDDTDEDLDKQP